MCCGLKNQARTGLPRNPSQGPYHVRLAAINKAYHLSDENTIPTKNALGIADYVGCGYALGMAKHLMIRFFRHNSTNLTDEFRTDEPTPHTLGYVDHYGNGRVDVTVQDPYTSRSRVYKNRSTMRGLGIMSRHLEAMGYKNCIEFQDLTS